jgi:hypothetical protein
MKCYRHRGALGEETSIGEDDTSTVMPPVKSGFVPDVTFTLIKCMNGYTPGYRSKISTLASKNTSASAAGATVTSLLRRCLASESFGNGIYGARCMTRMPVIWRTFR